MRCQVKSKERVQQHGEVFTNEREVKAMLDMVKQQSKSITATFLENTQDAPQRVYSLVPIQDFSKPWSDEELYKKYNLTDDEIAFIESMIKPMDLNGGDT
jgi:site-specific DNA-methyltransferase (adenine-specific)